MRLAIMFPLFLSTYSLFGQSGDAAAIENVITQVFCGFHQNDSALVRNAFTREVTMATVVRDRNNNPVLHRENALDDFLKAIASPKKEPWTEEIWNLTIQIDGDFASAWCEYAFYAGKTFSHCGVDVFHFHKTLEGWKIFHLADTRRKEGCAVPPEIKKKYEN
jgi:hypothetical protein